MAPNPRRPLRLALTGGTGFVGSRTADRLAREGHQVLRLQRQGNGALTWDLAADDPRLAEALRGCDAVIHLAAYIPANLASLDECAKCLDLNALGTLRLLRAAEAAGVRHFIHASTAALYAPAPAAANGSTREDAPLLPVRAPAYLASKLAAEVYVANAATRGMQCSVLRLASVYGPGMVDAGLIPNCYKQLKASGQFSVADGNRYQTDLVSVDDVVDAIAACLSQEQGRVYNIASGALTTPLEVATTLARLLSVDPQGITVAPPAPGPGPAAYGVLDIQAARQHLALTPRSLAEGLQGYVRSRA